MIMVKKCASILALMLCCLTIQGGYSQEHYDEQQQGGLLRGGGHTMEANSGGNKIAIDNSNEEDNWERSVEVQNDRDLVVIATRLYIFQCDFTFTGGFLVPDAADFSEMLRRTQIFYNRQVASGFGQNFRSVETSIDTDNGDTTRTTDTEYFIQFTTDVVIKEVLGVATPSQDTIKSLLLDWDRSLYLTNFADMIFATNVGVAITPLSTKAPTVSAMPSTSIAPSLAPTISSAPTASPSTSPSAATEAPSTSPSTMPSVKETEAPSAVPSSLPTAAPQVTTTVNNVKFEFIDDTVPPTFNSMNADDEIAEERIRRAYNDRFPDQYSNSFVDDSIELTRTGLSMPTEMNSIELTYSISAKFRTSGNVPTSVDMTIDMRNFGQTFYDELKDDIVSRNTWGGVDRMLVNFPTV